MPPTPPVSAADDFVLQLAVERGLLGTGQVEAARSVVAEHTDLSVPAPRVLEVLVGQGVLNARRVAELLAGEFGMPMAPDLGAVRVTGDTLELVPRAVALRYRLLPLARGAHTLRVAIADPLDTDGVDALGHMLKLAIEPLVATAEEITAAIDRFYGKDANSIDELLNDLAVGGAGGDESMSTTEESAADNVSDTQTDATIIKLVQKIIIEAIQRRPSDIHLEHLEKQIGRATA